MAQGAINGNGLDFHIPREPLRENDLIAVARDYMIFDGVDGRLKIDELVSRTYTLDEINDGFAALRSGQVARGVVVFD